MSVMVWCCATHGYRADNRKCPAGAARLAAELTGAASADVVDVVPGVERDPGYVSSVRPSSSTAGLAALRHRGVRRDR